MTVYLDRLGHLAADSLDELHAFAAAIGLRRAWFQNRGVLSHYDCTTASSRRRAQDHGAQLVDVRDMPAIVRAMNAPSDDPSARDDLLGFRPVTLDTPPIDPPQCRFRRVLHGRGD